MKMLSTLTHTTAIVVFAASMNANAALEFDGLKFNMYTTPDSIQDTLIEEKVYVNQDTTVAQGVDLTGSIGDNDGAVEAYWNTTDEDGLVGQGNGFAVIKGGAEDGLIHDLTFGVYNSYFEDVIFAVLPVNHNEIDLTVTGFFKDGSQESTTLTTSNGLEKWLALVDDTSNPFVEINLSSVYGIIISGPDNGDETDGGLPEVKQWEVSGVRAVPIPAAAWLFGSALIGLAGIARKRKTA